MTFKYYTMMGSRNIPENARVDLIKVSRSLHDMGCIGRSGGGGSGADECMEEGHNRGVLENCNIYLPWDGFNGKWSSDRGYINTPELKNYQEAYNIAEKLHPNWEACSKGVKALHVRNVYQILGNDLASPSSFVVCYERPAYTDRVGEVVGSKAPAVRLALNINVPVYNFWHNTTIRHKWESIRR